MKTERNEGDPNFRPSNKTHATSTSNGVKVEYVSKLEQNGHHQLPNRESKPTDSENKSKYDLSDIHTKVAKEKSTRSQQTCPTNQPGTSRSEQQARSTSCGFYYGIKSYLHHFYGPPDKEVLKSGEYVQGDDFKFLAEPQRKGCWVRAALWIGINLIVLGGIAMLVGYLTPPRQAIVGQFQEFTVFDRWAVNFNYHLIMCQLVGLITFSFGAVIVVCSLLVASCQPPTHPPAYLVMGAYLPTPTPGQPSGSSPTWGIHCIPLSGTIRSVQPQFIRSQY